MFYENKDFNQDLSKWNLKNCQKANTMFYKSNYNKNLDNMKINKDCEMIAMFIDCPLEKNPPKWYKEK